MTDWDSFETVKGPKPGASYCACRIVISPVKNPSQTKLFPGALAAQKSIISDESTIDAQSSWPFVPGKRLIKMLSLDDPIGFWKTGLGRLLRIKRDVSLLCVFYPTVLEFLPLTTFQIQLDLSTYHLDVGSCKGKSLAEEHGCPFCGRNTADGKMGEVGRHYSPKVANWVVMGNPSSLYGDSYQLGCACPVE